MGTDNVCLLSAIRPLSLVVLGAGGNLLHEPKRSKRPAQLVGAIQGAGDVQITNASIRVVGRDNYSYTHVHYHGTVKDLRTVLDAISNFRKIQQDTLAKATPGTIAWLFDYKEFLLFIDVNGSLMIMWGYGIPGAGKTILAYVPLVGISETILKPLLSSIVIDVLETLAREWGGQICVAYIYIRYSDQNQLTIKGILEVLVKQTVERHPDCLEVTQQTYGRHLHEGTQPSEAELLELLRQFAQKRKATFYVLDALDEAPVRIRLALVQKVSSLGVRLFITSRPLPVIEARFPAAHTFPILAQDQDLDLHIAEKIEASEDLQDLLQRGGPVFKRRLITTVKAKCGGMFLHAPLQLDALQQCFTVHDAMQTLEEFPRNIEDVYQQTWERIIQSDPHSAFLAKAAFVWVVNAKQPLTMDILRHALATSPDTLSFESSRLMSEAALMTVCRGLITTDKESRLVRLVHYTAEEPLENLLHTSFPDPHSLLAAICITRLADCGFQNKNFRWDQELEMLLDADPLLAYAYHAWDFHSRRSLNLDGRLTTFIAGCRAFPVVTDYDFDLRHSFDFLGPLHVVAFYNLPLAFAGPRNAHNTYSQTIHWRRTALHLACRLGHYDAVQSLIRLPDLLVNARDRNGKTPLMLACLNRTGLEGIAKLLLAHPDIDVNLADDYKWTVLMHVAGRYGNERIVKLLLAHPGTDANAASGHGSTALLLACQYGQTRIVEHLLAVPDININAVDSYNDTAIKIAAERRHEEIVRLILNVPGIDPYVRCQSGSNAMSMAILKGHHSIVQLLRDFERKPAVIPLQRPRHELDEGSVAKQRYPPVEFVLWPN